ncbi:hypothetical protein IKG33_01645 [Candidatus Saccharibacteria bacterium]|nr:hypothetical protein [Candidatus Saccharibacteria bacterium]
MTKRKNVMVVVLIVTMLLQVFGVGRTYADDEPIIEAGDVAMSVSPVRESIVLVPGDEYRSSFTVTNPGAVDHDLDYRIKIQAFYVDEEYNPVYDDKTNINQIVDWITLVSPERGTIHPNETDVVEFTIKVPEDAPSGGQYASITVLTDASDDDTGGGINIKESMGIAHLVFAEVTGNSESSGEILDAGIDTFLLGGNIRAYSMVNNTGNVHAPATYNMKVYPLFSNEAVYDTKDDPEVHYILPDRTFYTERFWYDTPMIGIFNVVYTIEYQGVTTDVTGMVIVCPWWLLLILVFLVISLIIRIITLIKLRRSTTRVV